MPFDKPTRNALARMVGAARERLKADLTAQLQTDFRLQPDGMALPLDGLTDDQRAAALDLRALLDHYVTSIYGPEKNRRALAFDRLVREIGFTVLNRLAALRLCEERELVLECVRKGMTSEGFQLFDRLTGGALGPRYETYRAFLENLFDELALDLGVLFDRSSPLSHVFPSERALEEVLNRLNDPALSHLWKEDETIGWIYQYYNDEAERKQMRDESQAPRNSRELAVRNQFFTPRYVVEFLTDNTLGRLWYEMRGGDTQLAEECRYLVRRPDESLPAEHAENAEKSPENSANSALSAVKNPRQKKDPREIKMLDPAGGSGHFGLYCFDLFEIIYTEAYDDANLGPALQAEYPDRAAFLCDVPRLILAHNIHIIDIDPRAVQIAALALWLRAQRSFQRMGLKPDERPQIRKVNVVCAEPMPGDRALLDEFAVTLRPAVLGDLVRVIFDKMQLAGEAGSLLKIEEEIQEAIAEAKRQWLNRDQAEQMSLFASERRPARAEQAPLFDLSGITDEQFWDEAEARVLEALQGYSELANNGAGARRKLFADDATHGFAFIDLCRQRYDVVLMNPPFGEPTKSIREILTINFIRTKHDLFATFCERALQLTTLNGLVGEISSRVGFFLKTFELWRKEVLGLIQITSIIDLGSGVLDDATVEAACYVIENKPVQNGLQTLVVRLLLEENKETSLLEALNNSDDKRRYSIQISQFDCLPLSPYIYWISQPTLNTLANHPSLEPVAAVVRQGLGTGDNNRFIRAIWEIPSTEIGGFLTSNFDEIRNQFSGKKRWAFHVRAGASQPWYSPLTLVIDWHNQGDRLKAHWLARGESPSRYIPSENLYFRPGFSWTLRAFRFIPYLIPSGCIPSASRYMAFPTTGKEITVVGLCASNVVTAFTRFYGEMFERPKHLVDTVKRVPFVDLNAETVTLLEDLISTEVEKRRNFYRNYEPFIDFTLPAKIKQWAEVEASDWDPFSFLGQKLEIDVALAFGLSPEQLSELEFDLQEAIQVRRRKTQDGKIEDEGTGDEEEAATETNIDLTPESLPVDLLSYFVGSSFGRWDIRMALDSTLAPKLQDPFDPLPVCPPGMLVGPDGLPATPVHIVSEEWLRARPNAITLPPEGAVQQLTIPDHQYPLRLAWDGILVDDPGLEGEGEHPDDIVRRVREALAVLWVDRAEAIEAEACELLGVPGLRDYFRKPSSFFADHLKRYSKSRRQAPIYWPLSTASGSYTVWLYYHRLTQDTLYTVVNQYVTPKIDAVQKRVDQLDEKRRTAEGKGRSTAAELEELKAFLRELTDFRAELLRVAALPYKPDLNDGVILNAAPLHKFFRLSKWAKDCKVAWDKLAAGEYDWAHIAYILWPDRVKKACATDRSIAIAHGLEALYKGEVKAAKAKKGKRKKVEDEGEAVEMGLE